MPILFTKAKQICDSKQETIYSRSPKGNSTGKSMFYHAKDVRDLQQIINKHIRNLDFRTKTEPYKYTYLVQHLPVTRKPSEICEVFDTGSEKE